MTKHEEYRLFWEEVEEAYKKINKLENESRKLAEKMVDNKPLDTIPLGDMVVEIEKARRVYIERLKAFRQQLIDDKRLVKPRGPRSAKPKKQEQKG